MFGHQGAPQNLESIRILIMLFAIITMIFWRAVLRIVVTIVAIVIVVLLASGAVALWQGLHL